MKIFIASAPATASNTLRVNLEKIFNSKAISPKLHGGFGHLHSKYDLQIKSEILKRKFKNQNILFYQHLFPTEYNLNIISKFINLEKDYFIVTKRNIIEIARHLVKRNVFLKKKSPLSFKTLTKLQFQSLMFNSKKFEIDPFEIILIINFFNMWIQIKKKKVIKNLLFLDFKEIVNQQQLVNKLADFLNISESFFTHEFQTKNKYQKENIKISNELDKLIYDYISGFNISDFYNFNLYEK